MPPMPVQQRRDVGDQAALVLRQHGHGLAQPDRPRALGGRRRRRVRTARAARGDHRRRLVGAGLRRVVVDREQRPVGPTPSRSASLPAAKREEREPFVHHQHAARTGVHRTRPRVGALRGDPGGVAPAAVARAVQSRPGERAAHEKAGTTSAASSSSTSSLAEQQVLEEDALHAHRLVLPQPLDDLLGRAAHPALGAAEPPRAIVGLRPASAPSASPCMSENVSVPGSRPAASQAARSRSRAAPASSGVAWTTLYSAAYRAASAAPRGFAAPPRISGERRLDGLGLRVEVLEHVVVAGERERPGREDPVDHLDLLGEPAERGVGEAERAVLGVVPARPEAELDPARPRCGRR